MRCIPSRPSGPRRLTRLLASILPCAALLALPRSAAVAPAAPAPAVVDQGWPQWRGPRHTGVGPAANPPTAWSETKNVRWKVRIPGGGTGTPVVWKDQVFLQTAVPQARPPATDAGGAALLAGGEVGDGIVRRGRGGFGGFGRSERPTEPVQFVLLCLDRRTGKTLWQKVAREAIPHEGHHRDHGFASQSAVTDGKYVYASFGSRGLYCYDLRGALKWKKDLGRMQTRNGFGEGSSPAVSGDTVVVNWDHEGEDFIVAFDRETGKERWRRPREEPTSWSTPLVVTHAGARQVVVAASNRIRSYELGSGKLVWECAGLTGNVVPTPVAGHGLLFAMSGFRGNALLAIRLGRTGDLTGTDAVAWNQNRTTPYVPSPLLYGARLYFFGGNTGILSSVDAPTGRPLIQAERVPGLQGVYASPVGAAGRVYLVDRNGTTVVAKDADKLEILATNRLDEKFDASPALVGTDLFLRGHQYLYCLGGR